MRTRTRLIAALALTVAAVLAGCAAGPISTGLPVYPIYNGSIGFPIPDPTIGTLRHEGDCVYVDTDAGRLLVVWPEGTAFDGAALTYHGRAIATVNGPVRMVGIAADDNRVRDLLVADLPAACRGNGVTVFVANPF